jgi:hypothetical protein
MVVSLKTSETSWESIRWLRRNGRVTIVGDVAVTGLMRNSAGRVMPAISAKTATRR